MRSGWPSPMMLTRGNSGYPSRLATLLGDKAPQSLYMMGNLDLLGQHAVSFCGARNASTKGIEAAALCARMATKKRFVIASGNARGVDRATHKEALERGGATILVLPEGIDQFRISSELADVWQWDRVLIISQFKPQTVWKTYHAMDRNKVIMGLSCAMIVVEAGEKGGTRAAGEEALRLGVPLFAVDYGYDETVAPGNRWLIKNGARPLKKSKRSGEPNLTELLSAASEFCSSAVFCPTSMTVLQKELF